MRKFTESAPVALALVAGALAATVSGCDKDQQMQQRTQTKVDTQRVTLVWKGGAQPWKVKLNGGGEVDPATAEIKIPAKGGPVMFIVNIAGSGRTFRTTEPLSVWTGPKMPTQTGISSPDIVGPILTNNGKLVFIDLNQGPPVKLNYALHFNNGVPSVDPIIDNGGGHDFN